MAKKEKQQGHNKGNQKNSGGRAGSVAANTEKSEAGRARKRNVSKLLETRRVPERQSGEFYQRTNAGRSNDIGALLRGELGDYAIPGGSEPSVHLSVQREVRKLDTISVVRLESIQEGHELSGAVFDTKVYLPCNYIGKFGTTFKSRSGDRLVAATQELICHYLARVSAELYTPPAEEVFRDKYDPFADAGTDYRSMLSEVPGQYIVHAGDGDVVFDAFYAKKVNVRVLASTSPRLSPSSAYVPVHCLWQPTLEQVTNNETYERQLALFMFIRTELSEFFTISTESRPVAMTGGESLPEADREALAKAQAKRERKAKNKHEKQREEQAAKMKVLTMKQNSIHPRNIVAGTLGYVDLSSSSGDLIVQFGMIGGDRIATIESLGDSHMLKLAGIKVGDSILANFIRFGICLADRTRLNMGTEEYRKKSIVAEHIREQMEQRGVRLLKPAASV